MLCYNFSVKDKKLQIQVNKTAEEVFLFTLDPKNTPLWIDSIVKEETNEKPTKQGTVYKNMNSKGQWSEYTITAFEKNKMFEMTSEDKNYHVRYTLSSLSNKTSELEYYEWVDDGDLEEPFTQDILNKLKAVLEK